MIRPLTFLHQPGTGGERAPGAHRPERLPLGRVKGIPEAGGGSRWTRFPGMTASRVLLGCRRPLYLKP